MILHIPHSSTNTKGYKLNNKCQELHKMTDHFTDELYQNEDATTLVFGVSRLICDVERFCDDEQEDMIRFGMGVCYTTTTKGEELRVVSPSDKEHILNTYYHPHHKALEVAVDKELQESTTSLIIDCHSFPDTAYYFNSDYKLKRPDICIGTDEFHTPKELVQKVKKYFLGKGYHVEVNKPYSGTMVPLKHYKKEKNVHSIMIELNRKLYMDECGYKTEHFSVLQGEIKELLSLCC